VGPAALVSVLQVKAMETVAKMDTEDLCNTLWALAAMKMKVEGGLVAALIKRGRAVKVTTFKPHQVSRFLWSLATMGVALDATLVSALGRRACTTAGRFQAKEIAEMMWAISVFDLALFDSQFILFDCMATRCIQLKAELTTAHKRLLHQWLLFCTIRPGVKGSLPESVVKMKQSMGPELLKTFSAEKRSSRLQGEVAKELSAMPDMLVSEGFRDPISGYTIDIRVRKQEGIEGTEGYIEGTDAPSGGGWAVEVDEQADFLQGGGERLACGATILKRNHLAYLGYVVVSVPFFEWEELSSTEDKHQYLEAKLPEPVDPEEEIRAADALLEESLMEDVLYKEPFPGADSSIEPPSAEHPLRQWEYATYDPTAWTAPHFPAPLLHAPLTPAPLFPAPNFPAPLLPAPLLPAPLLPAKPQTPPVKPLPKVAMPKVVKPDGYGRFHVAAAAPAAPKPPVVKPVVKPDGYGRFHVASAPPKAPKVPAGGAPGGGKAVGQPHGGAQPGASVAAGVDVAPKAPTAPKPPAGEAVGEKTREAAIGAATAEPARGAGVTAAVGDAPAPPAPPAGAPAPPAPEADPPAPVAHAQDFEAPLLELPAEHECARPLPPGAPPPTDPLPPDTAPPIAPLPPPLPPPGSWDGREGEASWAPPLPPGSPPLPPGSPPSDTPNGDAGGALSLFLGDAAGDPSAPLPGVADTPEHDPNAPQPPPPKISLGFKKAAKKAPASMTFSNATENAARGAPAKSKSGQDQEDAPKP